MNDTPTPDMDKIVADYVECRDVIKLLEARQKKEMEPLRNKQEQLSGMIEKFMSDHNLDKLATASGTAYTSTRWSASLADPDVFMTYVIENQKFDLLDRRASATAVRDFVEQHKALPPGCNLSGIQTVGVRRK